MERPRKKRVRKSKAVRRSEITEATLALIGKYGLQGTSVSRISEAVGLSKGALYRHFPSRDAVIAAVIGLMRERASSWLGQSSSTDAVQYLTELGDRHADWAADQFETFVHPMFELLAAGPQEDLTAELTARQLEVFQLFVDVVDEGKRQGRIRADVESGDVAWGMLMFAWAEDYARLLGVEQCITGGASTRNLKRLLASFATEPGEDVSG